MPIPDVQLGLKPTVVLPQTIKVPVKVMNECGLSRHVAITKHKQVVPKPLRDWMLTQIQFKAWFTGEPEVVVPVEVAAPETVVEADAQTTEPVIDETPASPAEVETVVEADAQTVVEDSPEAESDDDESDDDSSDDDDSADESGSTSKRKGRSRRSKKS